MVVAALWVSPHLKLSYFRCHCLSCPVLHALSLHSSFCQPHTNLCPGQSPRSVWGGPVAPVMAMSHPVTNLESTVIHVLYDVMQAALSWSGRYQKYARQFITSSTPSEQCGQYDQLTSQFPGAGPCYAVWAQTYPWFYRSVHFILWVQACPAVPAVLISIQQTRPVSAGSVSQQRRPVCLHMTTPIIAAFIQQDGLHAPLLPEHNDCASVQYMRHRRQTVLVYCVFSVLVVHHTYLVIPGRKRLKCIRETNFSTYNMWHTSDVGQSASNI